MMSERRVNGAHHVDTTPRAPEMAPLAIGMVIGAVAGVLSAQFTSRVWVTGDVVSVRRRGPIVFGELRCDGQTLPFVARYPDGHLARALKVGVGGVWDVAIEYWKPSSTVQLVVYGVAAGSIARAVSARRLDAVREKISPLVGVNARRPLSAPPSRVAVVAGEATEGLADFQSAVDHRTEVAVVSSPVSGEDAARPIAAAIDRAGRMRDVEVVAVVRGGGSKSDMVWANTEEVCQAVAMCPRPVWVGVGHLDDRHLLDEVAARSFSTPAACGAETKRLWSNVDRAATEKTLQRRHHDADRARQMAEREAIRQRRRVRRLLVMVVVLVLILVWWLTEGTVGP